MLFFERKQACKSLAAVAAAILAVIFAQCAQAGASSLRMIRNDFVRIAFDPGIGDIADEVLGIYPTILSDLEQLLGLQLKKVPTIVLLINRPRFLASADHPLTVAYAQPEKQRIVMDVSKVRRHPFQFDETFRHELCHLLLHNHFAFIPRFMDEGICQWAGGGMDEMLPGSKQDVLNRAAIADRIIPFRKLVYRFPEKDSIRILAYAQSKSFVTFLFEHYSKETVFELMRILSAETPIEEAFLWVMSKSLSQLEDQWKATLASDPLWIVYVTRHLYPVLFFLMAVITCIGFLRMKWRKRHIPDEDDFE
jgi:hypothetical protein